MPLQIENENPVLLNADYDTGNALYLLYESTSMASTAPHIQLDLTEPGANDMYHTRPSSAAPNTGLRPTRSS